jgi:rhodanese-related sulfurtransferase
MKLPTLLAAALALLLAAPAEPAGPAAPGKVEPPWTYQSRRLDRAAVDALLRHPESLLFVDVRRPDEIGAIGGFPVYLGVQLSALEASLPFIPRDRTLVTVSNHAHRAGAAADVLAAHGFTVAGAVGTQDYEAQGGTVIRIPAPPASPAAASR